MVGEQFFQQLCFTREMDDVRKDSNLDGDTHVYTTYSIRVSNKRRLVVVCVRERLLVCVWWKVHIYIYICDY